MILMRTLVRPGELRLAKWEEIDFDKAQWNIPAERMKMRNAHTVSLSKQTAALVSNLKSITGNSVVYVSKH